ncbi:IS3 family transposase [Allohahella marinimesophila]|uniref:IS3 family transposase n=2 Tax=Allohahella marinimesophila TaxID=1054972 RepID=A0ABP7PTR6_9GAMM
MAEEGAVVTVSQVCRWAGYSRRSWYYKTSRAKPKINLELATRVKRLIDTLPYAGYRTVAWLLGENKNTIQRLFQLKGWQVRKRRVGMRPRVEAKRSFAEKPNERWATDLARVWCGEQHRWCALAIVMDCHTREALGWRLSSAGNAATAEAALEEALIYRYGALGRAPDEITLRSDNGLVFTSRKFTKTVYQYGLKQEFIRPHTPQQNGMVERLIRTVKEQCLWLHNFQNLDEARQALRAWFLYYNDHRPHQSLGMKTPNMVYQLAA